MKKLFAFLSLLILTFALPTKADNIISRCSELAINLNLPENICDGELNGLENKIKSLSLNRNKELIDLGIYLRQLGYLDASKNVMDIAISNVLITDVRYPGIKLSIANITYAKFKDAVLITDTYDSDSVHRANSEGVQKAQQAFSEYEELFGNLQTSTSIKAALNWLRLWTELNQNISKVRVLKQSNEVKFKQIVYALNERFSFNTNSNENNEYRLSLAEVLTQADNQDFQLIAEDQLDRLMRIVDINFYPRTYSRILGARGALYQLSSPGNAIDSYSKARQAALLGQYPDLAFRWDGSLAKLYRAQGKTHEAKSMYREAMQQIDAVRAGSLPFVRNVQYQSYSRTIPIYRDYLDLLFTDQALDYDEILKVYEKQKRSELEYFLQCSQIDAVGLSQLPSYRLADMTIYVIRRPAQYEILARFKNGLIKHHSIAATDLDKALTEAKKYSSAVNLKIASSNDIHSVFGRLYTLILSPFEASLPPKGALVTFVIDSAIQNIPLNALYTPSGRYFLQDYTTSYSLGVQKLTQKGVSSNQQKMLLAGISTELQEFPSLPAVEMEVNNIAKLFPHAKRMLNSGFKKDDFFKFGTKSNILHIASHAVFSSDPQETFILAWDGRIGLGDLQRFADSSPARLDLLFFSSCDSSKGSPFSVLGITGTSLRAGARAAIASQWQIEDRAMAELATDFYRRLREGQSPAQALRSAQIKALQSDNPTSAKFANWAGVGLYEQ
jgi:CHAT domain-containing protein